MEGKHGRETSSIGKAKAKNSKQILVKRQKMKIRLLTFLSNRYFKLNIRYNKSRRLNMFHTLSIRVKDTLIQS